MSSFKEKERFKEQQEQFQAVLSALLKDEDNKYCVDCDAKGPRWASWNLGIFLCIRCAGIHRNLGVHISKVKSVNLDTWTPEQVAMMQEMGNSRGRAVYEANIPDGFRRPQTDSALEAFIRSKYEQKKYIAREWVPPQPKIPKERVNNSAWLDDARGDKKKTKSKHVAGTLQLTNINKLASKQGEITPPGDLNKPAQGAKPEVKVTTRTELVSNTASSDLLGLDLGSAQTNAHQQAAAPPVSYGNNELLDLFGGPQAPSDTVSTQSNSDLMNGTSEAGMFGEDKSAAGVGAAKTSAKDSIMALYGGGGGGGTNQPQMYGVPGGVYMPQGQQMYPGNMSQQQGMMGVQGIRQPHSMMPQGMIGQPPGMGMMGQAPGMMGNPGMNPPQMMVYNTPMMTGMYTPQQMQQLQFQQMQQQMTSLKLGGPQMGSVPQQTTGTGSWGAPAQGQTLSTNLWQ